MNCLVTGGAGFIGSHLVDTLIQKGGAVIVLDDFSFGKEENLAHHKGNKNLYIYRKSVCDDLADIFKKGGIEVVFHLAALLRVQLSIQDPIKTHKVNVNGTLNLLDMCKKFDVKRMVFASTCTIYGDRKDIAFNEDMTPNPISPYALHKLIGEHYCNLYYKLYGVETISLRYFNVFGPRQNPQGDYGFLIPKFITLMSQHKKPTINGDGKQTRDFVYVSDVVEATVLAANAKRKNLTGQTLNIGSGKSVSVNKVTRRLIKLSNNAIEPLYGPTLIEPRHMLANISKAKKILGWEPKVSFEEGLTKTYEFFTHL